MTNRQILFTRPNVAELVENTLPDAPGPGEVLVKTAYTAVSAGTERANLTGDPNISGLRAQCGDNWPRALGYSASGTVLAVGEGVTGLTPGQQVIVFSGKHARYNLTPAKNVVPLGDGRVSMQEAALLYIAGFPAQGIRKTHLEFGERAMVVGLGILGLFAVQLCRIAGAAPVIAVDPDPVRRALAEELGADVTLDPTEPDFPQRVKDLCDGVGVDVAVEVSGRAQALRETLLCMNMFGRVSLLGCTRTPDVYDLYHDVHFPGVSLIGANNWARPRLESRPGNWTTQDDLRALLRLTADGRLKVKRLIHEVRDPREAPAVYDRLAAGKDFPIGVLFDWSCLDGEEGASK